MLLLLLRDSHQGGGGGGRIRGGGRRGRGARGGEEGWHHPQFYQGSGKGDQMRYGPYTVRIGAEKEREGWFVSFRTGDKHLIPQERSRRHSSLSRTLSPCLSVCLSRGCVDAKLSPLGQAGVLRGQVYVRSDSRQICGARILVRA